jgi:alanine-glyoxylate transaminase/serine-glyoxylate transaminase/serine-pyruvate transaminase
MVPSTRLEEYPMRTGQTPARPQTAMTQQRPRSAQILPMRGCAETAWEATIASTLSPGDRVLVLCRGTLATLWSGIATRCGITIEGLDFLTEAAIARHLGADRFGEIKAVFLALEPRETAAVVDILAVRRALDSAFHDALLLVDASVVSEPDIGAADIAITDPRAGLARLIAPHRPIAAE